MFNTFVNWKTTLGGFVVMVAAITHELAKLFDNNPATDPDVTLMIAAVAIFAGLASARDADKTSEDNDV